VLTYSFDLLSMSVSSFITLIVIFSRLAYTMVQSPEPNGLVLLYPTAAYRKSQLHSSSAQVALPADVP